jgi:hypothetical protein
MAATRDAVLALALVALMAALVWSSVNPPPVGPAGVVVAPAANAAPVVAPATTGTSATTWAAVALAAALAAAAAVFAARSFGWSSGRAWNTAKRVAREWTNRAKTPTGPVQTSNGKPDNELGGKTDDPVSQNSNPVPVIPVIPVTSYGKTGPVPARKRSVSSEAATLVGTIRQFTATLPGIKDTEKLREGLEGFTKDMIAIKTTERDADHAALTEDLKKANKSAAYWGGVRDQKQTRLATQKAAAATSSIRDLDADFNAFLDRVNDVKADAVASIEMVGTDGFTISNARDEVKELVRQISYQEGQKPKNGMARLLGGKRPAK